MTAIRCVLVGFGADSLCRDRQGCRLSGCGRRPAHRPGSSRLVAGAVRRQDDAVIIRVLLGLACAAVVVWVAGTRWSTLLAGHPAYPVLLAVVAVVGGALLVTARRTRRGGAWRIAGRVAAALLLVAVLAATVWLRPYPADGVAVAAATPSATVDVVGSPTAWELRPARPAGSGVVFFPGALVDPRAYLALLRPLAEQGHLVVVLKPPLDVALLSAATPVLDAHPDVAGWAVGGHSLGGVSAAATVGDPRVRGVFFWASYPARDLSGANVAAASISGERDGLSTPADIDASRAQLPPATVFTQVPGAVHAFFGDYGPQAGDGEPSTDRATAQRLIVAATARFVDGLDRP
jgi:Alpha/beta hydrolase family